MHIGSAADGGASPPWVGVHHSVDRRAYESYVRRQAQGLLDMIPREGLRPLYGRAREWARENGVHDEKDPMATLLRFCGELLPLPPFHVWLDDVAANAGGHLAELGRSPERDTGDGDSLPVETRSFAAADGDEWLATLSLYRAGPAWKGLIRFHGASGAPTHRTASIFREDDPDEIRTRFRGFDESALLAFLRSARP